MTIVSHSMVIITHPLIIMNHPMIIMNPMKHPVIIPDHPWLLWSSMTTTQWSSNDHHELLYDHHKSLYDPWAIWWWQWQICSSRDDHALWWLSYDDPDHLMIWCGQSMILMIILWFIPWSSWTFPDHHDWCDWPSIHTIYVHILAVTPKWDSQ